MLKETLNKTRKNVSSFILRSRCFGFNVALWSFLSNHQRRIKVFSRIILKMKHKSIMNYLCNNYSEIIDRYVKKPTGELKAVDNQSAIWVCWWDGKDKMPEIVKVCFQSVCINSGGHPVRLVTKHNYQEYVNIPVYIVEKVKRGMITITHFSDILRMSLLCQHGGFWVDATILMTKPVPPIQNAGFFTVKHKNGETYVSECRWTGFCIGGSKGNILFNYLTDMLFEYWKREVTLVEYLLVDYLIAIAYESVDSIKEMIDKNPFNNLQLYNIQYKLNAEYDKVLFEKICADTSIHKLTWKGSFQRTTPDGKPTFYGHLLSKLTPY